MSAANEPRVRYVPLEEAHLDAVMAIEVEAYPEPWGEQMFRDEIRYDKAYFYVVFLADEIVGYGGFWLVLDEAHLTSVTIRDVFRSRGYGRRLLTFLEETAKGLGARMASLEVRASNHRARNLYCSSGYKAVGIRKGYYARTNEDAVVMLKDLEQERPPGQDTTSNQVGLDYQA